MVNKFLVEIDSICIHGDNESSLATAKSIKDNLIDNDLILKPLNKMKNLINYDKKIFL